MRVRPQDGVLIPYQQGGLLRHNRLMMGTRFVVLNPLSAGRSFQTLSSALVQPTFCLNPLSAGRSFQTMILKSVNVV